MWKAEVVNAKNQIVSKNIVNVAVKTKNVGSFVNV